MTAYQDTPDVTAAAGVAERQPAQIQRVRQRTTERTSRSPSDIVRVRMSNQISLGRLDLVIFVLYMFAAVGLGFLVSLGRKRTTRGYFLGGKTLPWYVIASSMLASDVSSEHFIANAGIGHKYGIVAATASWNCWIIYSIFIWIFCRITSARTSTRFRNSSSAATARSAATSSRPRLSPVTSAPSSPARYTPAGWRLSA
jgi:hypothetical protein